jgi:hypothetical protein
LEAIASQFQPLLASIKAAVDQQNWRAGLALALMLPDICGKIETPEESPHWRYVKWWEKFGTTYEYESRDGATNRVKAEEVFQLRCAYLHEGSDSLDPDKVQEHRLIVEWFNFTVSNHHLRKVDNTVLLKVETFCQDTCSRVGEWEKSRVIGNLSKEKMAENLLKIYAFVELSGEIGVSGSVSTLLKRTKKSGSVKPQKPQPPIAPLKSKKSARKP